jgi:hypothetical protein
VFEVTSTLPSASPSHMEVTLEGSIFAQTAVNQVIEVFNFNTGSFEQVDVRNASRFADSTTTIELTDDLSRFIEPVSNAVLARVRYQSVNSRQSFASNIDRFSWAITE